MKLAMLSISSLVVQSLSCVRLCDLMESSTTVLLHYLKLMSIESVTPSNRLILCCPLLLLPSIFPSMRVFSNESALHQVAKVLEFQLQHIPRPNLPVISGIS